MGGPRSQPRDSQWALPLRQGAVRQWSWKCPQWRCLFLPDWAFICSRSEGEAQVLGFSPKKAPWASPAHCRKPGGCPPHPSFVAGHGAGGLLQSLPFSPPYRALGHSTWLRFMGRAVPPVALNAPVPRGSCCACLWRRHKSCHIRDTPSCVSGKTGGELVHELAWQLQRLLLPSTHPLCL